MLVYLFATYACTNSLGRKTDCSGKVCSLEAHGEVVKVTRETHTHVPHREKGYLTFGSELHTHVLASVPQASVALYSTEQHLIEPDGPAMSNH